MGFYLFLNCVCVRHKLLEKILFSRIVAIGGRMVVLAKMGNFSLGFYAGGIQLRSLVVAHNSFSCGHSSAIYRNFSRPRNVESV